MYVRKRVAQRRWMLVLGILFAVVLVLLQWWQGHARRAGMRSPVERGVIAILSPSMRIASAVRDDFSPDPAYPSDPLATRVGMDRLTLLEEENRQLRALLTLRDTLPTGAIASEIIHRSTNPWQPSLMLGKGQREGVEPRMVALTPDGVIGQVATVTGHTAQLLLLTDPASGIGAMVARTRETGVLKGFRNGKCRLIYLSDQADVQPGDEIITSGVSDYYPKGLPLGTVKSVKEDPSLSSRTAIVTPTADPFATEFVVLTKPVE